MTHTAASIAGFVAGAVPGVRHTPDCGRRRSRRRTPAITRRRPSRWLAGRDAWKAQSSMPSECNAASSTWVAESTRRASRSARSIAFVAVNQCAVRLPCVAIKDAASRRSTIMAARPQMLADSCLASRRLFFTSYIPEELLVPVQARASGRGPLGSETFNWRDRAKRHRIALT